VLDDLTPDGEREPVHVREVAHELVLDLGPVAEPVRQTVRHLPVVDLLPREEVEQGADAHLRLMALLVGQTGHDPDLRVRVEDLLEGVPPARRNDDVVVQNRHGVEALVEAVLERLVPPVRQALLLIVPPDLPPASGLQAVRPLHRLQIVGSVIHEMKLDVLRGVLLDGPAREIRVPPHILCRYEDSCVHFQSLSWNLAHRSRQALTL
jgi:hypothetical protein